MYEARPWSKDLPTVIWSRYDQNPDNKNVFFIQGVNVSLNIGCHYSDNISAYRACI